jgi:hemerythrin-like domain-containing protein
MNRLTDRMLNHHKHCDDAFAAAEAAAQKHDWSKCAGAFESFRTDLETHLGTEEQLIFPAFEQRSGMFGGPTQVMRMEHTQMRGLVRQMETALAARDADAFAGAADTLLVLMQQHNMKEENILYPMCDQVLGEDAKLLGEVDRALATA